MIRLLVLAMLFAVSTSWAHAEVCKPGSVEFELIQGPVVDEDTERSMQALAWNESDEELVAVWRDDSNFNLFAQRYDADLEPIDSSVNLTNSNGVQPQLEWNPVSERYALTWKTQDSEVGPFNSLVARVFNAGLGLMGTELSLSSSTSGFEGWLLPDLETGNFVATSRFDIRMYGINSDGTAGGTSPILDTGSAAPNGSIAHNRDDDEFLATWRSQSNNSLEGRLLDDELEPIGDVIEIHPQFPESLRAAYTFWDPVNEHYTVVFKLFDEESILARTVQPDGQPDEEFEVLIPDEGESIQLVQARWNEAFGGFVVVWNDETGSNIQLFDGHGQALTPAKNVSEFSDTKAAEPTVMVDLPDRGETVLMGSTWIEDEGDFTTTWRYRTRDCQTLFMDRFETAIPD